MLKIVIVEPETFTLLGIKGAMEKSPDIEVTGSATCGQIGFQLVEQTNPGANLSGANLTGANLSGANLKGTNLESANLSDANLESANLSDANNLTPELVKAAQHWQQACYGLEFRKTLGLPPENRKECTNP